MRSLFRLFTQQPLAAKVPEITVLFWVIKILTTAAGEAISDYVRPRQKAVGRARRDRPSSCVALVLQFGTRRYFAPAYWFLALAIAIAGHRRLRHHAPDLRHSLRRDVAVLGRRARGRLLPLGPQRAHAVDPLHHDQPAGEVLLGHHLRHVRPRHRGRGLHRHDARAGLPRLGHPLLRRHPDPVGRLVAVPDGTRSSPSGSPTSSPGPSGPSFADYFSKAQGLSGAGFGDLPDGARHHAAGRDPGAYTAWPASTFSRPTIEVAGGT